MKYSKKKKLEEKFRKDLENHYNCFSLDSARDDEHRLIARYAAKLAQEQRTGMVSVSKIPTRMV